MKTIHDNTGSLATPLIENERLVDLFLYSTAFIFLFTGAAKLLAILGHDEVFGLPDPLLGVRFRYLLLLAGAIELIVGSMCLTVHVRGLKLALVGWTSTLLLTYRAGLRYLGYLGPCHCLGSLTGILRISPSLANLIMKYVLAYLTIGSGASLLMVLANPAKDKGTSKRKRPE